MVNAKNIEKDYNWIKSNISGEIELSNQSAETGMLSIQGPNAEAVLQKITRQRLCAIQYYWFTTGIVAGIDCIISRSGFTGEDGFEIYCDTHDVVKLWNALMEAGKEVELKPIGLYAKDSLRLENRLVAYGLDIDDNTTPLEASLNWTVNFNKGYFIGYDALWKQKEFGLNRTLVGFELPKGPIPKHGTPVTFKNKRIGRVTSCVTSPTVKQTIGLAYVPMAFKEIGAKFDIEIHGKYFSATVIETPFYRR